MFLRRKKVIIVLSTHLKAPPQIWSFEVGKGTKCKTWNAEKAEGQQAQRQQEIGKQSEAGFYIDGVGQKLQRALALFI